MVAAENVPYNGERSPACGQRPSLLLVAEGLGSLAVLEERLSIKS